MKKIISVLVAVVLVFVSVGVAPVPAVSAAAPKAITLSKTSKTVYVGQKYKLKVKAVTPKKADTAVKWKTSDKKIATVDKNGTVTGKKKGTVTITAVSKANSKIKAKCKVTVKKFKTTNIDYKDKVISGGELELYNLDFDSSKHEDPYIIKTYEDLKNLKKRIKKSYGISPYYDEDSMLYGSENLKKELIGDNIIEKLDKYDRKFFKTKALYYNCIDFSTIIEGEDIKYSFDCVKVQKKISSKGKLTCYMYVKRNIKDFKPFKEQKVGKTTHVGSSSAYFIELNKKDISGVQDYKLKHYEAIDLEVNELYTTYTMD